MQRLGRRNLILRSLISSRSPRVTRPFRYGGAPYKFFIWRAPYKFCVRAHSANSVGGPLVTLPWRVARCEAGPQPAGCIRRKIAKKQIAACGGLRTGTHPGGACRTSDIRASSRPPRVTHISTDRKIKLRRPQRPISEPGSEYCWSTIPTGIRDYPERSDHIPPTVSDADTGS
jgi:hypothetical protein